MVAIVNTVLRSDYKGGRKVKKQANPPGPGPCTRETRAILWTEPGYSKVTQEKFYLKNRSQP